MTWSDNQYYPLSEADKSAIQCTTALLQAYPLTRACLESLGTRLLNNLEFGFFTEGQRIIAQGEKGKDMFLLCQGKVDVIVNRQVVVQMEGPRLLGDKALVELDSKRAATIQVSKGEVTLWLKIPMGRFIRNFNDSAIPDYEFQQEVSIFSFLFQGIQQRLFDFIFLQKKMLGEVRTHQELANIEAISKVLNDKLDLRWKEDTWTAVEGFLANELGFKWPKSVPLNVNTFQGGLTQFVEYRFPRNIFKGTEAEYLSKKHLLFSTWMTRVSRYLFQQLPKTDLPIQISELELFNPRNYHLRISQLLGRTEKHFEQRLYIPPGETQPQPMPKSSKFFGKGERSNEFNLERYFSSFEKHFKANNPKRMQAQIAQRVALIAAECENQFNASIAKMAKFLETVKEKYNSQETVAVDTKNIEKELQRQMQVLQKGFNAYDRKFLNQTSNDKGGIRVMPGHIPNLNDLIKSVSIAAVRRDLELAFFNILKLTNLQDKLLLDSFSKECLFICRAKEGDFINEYEFHKHYWIPISPAFTLMIEKEKTDLAHQGYLLSAPGWQPAKVNEQLEMRLQITPPVTSDEKKEETYIILILISSYFPWSKRESPYVEEFMKQYLPLMQWLVNKHIEMLKWVVQKRDKQFQNWHQLDQIVRLEKKISEFESSKKSLNLKEHKAVVAFLKNTLSLPMTQAVWDTDQFAKHLYNFIVRQMGLTYPEMPIEERSNQAYTKWRFVLSEIIKITERSQPQEEHSEESISPLWEILQNELKVVVDAYYDGDTGRYMRLTQEEPVFGIGAMLTQHGEENVKTMIMLFKILNAVFQKYIFQAIKELHTYDQRLTALQDARPQRNSEELQLEIIQENINRLAQILRPALKKTSDSDHPASALFRNVLKTEP
ncbi:cyclic nucleotide-binding domain-containing protein [Deltaproteobacteria bacterium TL4]